MSRLALSLLFCSLVLGLGHYFASRPPAWIERDPLQAPFGLASSGDGQIESTRAEDWSLSRQAPVEFPLDINAATASELIQLPGVGPVLARRILVHRDSLDGLRALQQLDVVRGIGPSSLEKLKSLVVFGEFPPRADSTAQALQNAKRKSEP